MCAGLGTDIKPDGIRILDGMWCDAYLGRVPVRPGYCYVIWKGRHVAEPTELSPEESHGFWREVTAVATAIEHRYRPVKMNWLSLGNWVPHLHVHLVPRHADDPCAGGPLEQDAFDHEGQAPLDDATLRAEAKALRNLVA
jgi:diadenosine tetraphosphate (Ap4A) HIT family hydrolase